MVKHRNEHLSSIPIQNSLPVHYGTPGKVLPPKHNSGLIQGSLWQTFLGNDNESSLMFQVLKINVNQYLKTKYVRNISKEYSNIIEKTTERVWGFGHICSKTNYKPIEEKMAASLD